MVKVPEGFVRRLDHVVWKPVQEKAILLNLENGAYFDVDPVGLEIWQLCDGLKKVPDVAAKISQKFNVDLKRATEDTAEFIADLKKAKLVEIIPQPKRAAVKD